MSDHAGFWLHQGEMYCESVALSKIAAEVGTPTYVYSSDSLARNCHGLTASFSSYPTLACYAVKANTNVEVMRKIFSQGLGADVVSVGELKLALEAGAKANQIVFSGVAKQRFEIETALNAGILSFNVESADELQTIREVARAQGKRAPVSLRINPNIDPKTDPKITTGLYATKFGITEPEAKGIMAGILGDAHLELVGLSCHLGSQIAHADVFEETSRRMSALALDVIAQGASLKFLDLGGGLGISYSGEKVLGSEEYAAALLPSVRKTGLRLVIEPGRAVVGTTGVLLTSVITRKSTPLKKFVVVDAGMNDLIRPALYDSFHRIEPVRGDRTGREMVDVVGPVCETSDCFASNREMAVVEKGDLLMIRDAGAYGYSMASTYNSRPLPAEVLVERSSFRVIRPRGTI